MATDTQNDQISAGSNAKENTLTAIPLGVPRLVRLLLVAALLLGALRFVTDTASLPGCGQSFSESAPPGNARR